MGQLIQFTRTPIRAYVIIPGEDPKLDQCRVKRGGYAFEDQVLLTRGTLKTLIYHLRSQEMARGLPITVHPECERRAAA